MEKNKDIQFQPKRRRLSTPRKWLWAEQQSLMEFLLENRDFEKPTAQVYYKRFSDEKKVLADWKQVRSKVRNMRVSYNKAKDWERSTDRCTMEDDRVKNTLLKMCSFYNELDDIFGSRLMECAVIEDSMESYENMSNYIEITDDTATASDNSIYANLPSTRRNRIYSRDAVSDIMEMQSKILTLKSEKFERDSKIKEREILVKENEIQLKEKELQLKKELKLMELESVKEMKMMDINMQKELKIMELQMKERLAMEELKLKFK